MPKMKCRYSLGVAGWCVCAALGAVAPNGRAAESGADAAVVQERLKNLEDAFARFRRDREQFEAQLQEKDRALAASETARREAAKTLEAAEYDLRKARSACEALERDLAKRGEELDAARAEAATNAAAGEASGRLLAEARRTADDLASKVAELERQRGAAEKRMAEERAQWEKERATRPDDSAARDEKPVEAPAVADSSSPDLLARLAALEAENTALKRQLEEARTAGTGRLDRPVPRASRSAPASASGMSPEKKALWEQAMQHRDAGRWAEAARAYESLLFLDARDVRASAGLAECRLMTGDVEGAKRTAAQLLAKHRDNTRVLLLCGRIESEQGRMAQALPFFERAVKMDDKDVDAHRELAMTYHELRKVPEAAREFQRVIMLDPEDGEAHFNLAALLLMAARPDFKLAAQLYERALKLGEPPDEKIESLLRSKQR